MQSCKQHHHTILLVLVCHHHQTKLNFYACCFSPTFLEQTFLLSSPHIFLGNGFQWATLLYCSCLYSARFLLLPSFHVLICWLLHSFSELWKIIEKRIISFIERPSVIAGTSKHEKFNWFMWLYVLHKSVTWASQITWGQKSVYNFGKQKSPFFFSIHVGNCYMNWHEFQHVYVWRINVQVSYPYTIRYTFFVKSQHS